MRKTAFLAIPACAALAIGWRFATYDTRCEEMADYVRGQAASLDIAAGKLVIWQYRVRCRNSDSFRAATVALDAAEAEDRKRTADAVVAQRLAAIAAQESLEKEAKEKAFVAAELFVGQGLVSPGSAKYGGERIQLQDDGSFMVWGWVDSQNRFGALLRSTWRVRVRLDPGGGATRLGVADIEEP